MSKSNQCSLGDQVVELRMNRKDKIEALLIQAQNTGDEAQAWRRFCRELQHLSHPESAMPKFKDLLHACWIAASNDQT